MMEHADSAMTAPADPRRVSVPCVLCGPGDRRIIAHPQSLYSDDRFRVVQCPYLWPCVRRSEDKDV